MHVLLTCLVLPDVGVRWSEYVALLRTAEVQQQNIWVPENVAALTLGPPLHSKQEKERWIYIVIVFADLAELQLITFSDSLQH